jgi:hypothetical protein
MTTEPTTGPRISERAAGDPNARRRRRRLGAPGPAGFAAFAVFVVLAALAGASCRQTVILDSKATGGLTPDAASTDDAAADGFFHFDGARLDGLRPPSFCTGGQIVPLLATMRVPDLIFAVDHSSAMQSSFGAGTRIQMTQQAIKALIFKYQRVIHFGYEEFPSTSGTCSAASGCCGGDVVPPAPNTLSAIDHVMHRCDGGGADCMQSQSPLANALDKCGETFSTFMNNNGARYLIALVGGDPTCQGPDPTSSPCADAVGAVASLSRASVRSTLFGIGAETAGSLCLDKIALQTGLQVGTTSPYYHLARTPGELTAELDPLVKTMAEESCHIDILTPPADPDQVSVLFDGAPVDIDSANGWTFDRNSSVGLTLHGTACDTLISQAPRVEVIAGCSSPRH